MGQELPCVKVKWHGMVNAKNCSSQCTFLVAGNKTRLSTDAYNFFFLYIVSYATCYDAHTSFPTAKGTKNQPFKSTCHQIARNIRFWAMCEEPCWCVIQHRYVIRVNEMTDYKRALLM